MFRYNTNSKEDLLPFKMFYNCSFFLPSHICRDQGHNFEVFERRWNRKKQEAKYTSLRLLSSEEECDGCEKMKLDLFSEETRNGLKENDLLPSLSSFISLLSSFLSPFSSFISFSCSTLELKRAKLLETSLWNANNYIMLDRSNSIATRDLQEKVFAKNASWVLLDVEEQDCNK